jgi:hypothetical protein
MSIPGCQLRAQVDQMARQKTLARLLESAHARSDEDEYPLVLQKIHEVLQIDPGNAASIDLKDRIEGRRGDRQFEKWIELSRQHAGNHAYAQHTMRCRTRSRFVRKTHACPSRPGRSSPPKSLAALAAPAIARVQ